MPSPRVYMTLSRSGQMRRPCSVMSSPVFTTAVMSSSGRAARTPRRKRAPPMPPARTVIRTPRTYAIGFRRTHGTDRPRSAHHTDAASAAAYHRRRGDDDLLRGVVVDRLEDRLELAPDRCRPGPLSGSAAGGRQQGEYRLARIGRRPLEADDSVHLVGESLRLLRRAIGERGR